MIESKVILAKNLYNIALFGTESVHMIATRPLQSCKHAQTTPTLLPICLLPSI